MVGKDILLTWRDDRGGDAMIKINRGIFVEIVCDLFFLELSTFLLNYTAFEDRATFVEILYDMDLLRKISQT